MPSFTLPDPLDAVDTIIDCLAVVPVSWERREQVVKNCEKAIVLLIEAGQLVCDAGPDEEAVFVHFLRALCSQVEARSREKNFAALLQKLSTCESARH